MEWLQDNFCWIEASVSVCQRVGSGAGLDQFTSAWNAQYSQIVKFWRNNIDNLIILFDYPPEIKKAI